MQKDKLIKILICMIIIMINIILIVALAVNIKSNVDEIKENSYVSENIDETNALANISSTDVYLTLLNILKVIGGILVFEGCFMLFIIRKR